MGKFNPKRGDVIYHRHGLSDRYSPFIFIKFEGSTTFSKSGKKTLAGPLRIYLYNPTNNAFLNNAFLNDWYDSGGWHTDKEMEKMATKVKNSLMVERWKWFIPGNLSTNDRETLADILEKKCWNIVNRSATGDCSEPQEEWNRFVSNTVMRTKQ